MAHVELICDICQLPRTVDQHEVDGLIAAVQRGEQLKCQACGASLDGPFQRVLGLALPASRPPQEFRVRRRYVRLPLNVAATYQPPGRREGSGQVRNLGDGGLLLLAPEVLPPPTPLELQLNTRQGERRFKGAVVWNDAAPAPIKPTIRHGVCLTTPIITGMAVDLYLAEHLSGQAGAQG